MATGNNTIIGYLLKADIRHYFASVDHELLMHIIGRKIKDGRLLHLIDFILENHDTKIHGKGMPIGNLTSQLFANIYLNELDYFVKYSLRAQYYIKYLDDFIILHQSKEKLIEWKEDIAEFLKTIRLELHPEKSQILPLHNGVNFVGYRIFFHYKLLKKSNIKIIWKRIDKFKELYDNGTLSNEMITQSLESWMAYAKYANSYKLGERIYKHVNNLFGSKITSQVKCIQCCPLSPGPFPA